MCSSDPVVCEFHLRVCEKMFWRKDRSCLGTSEGRALILVPTHRNRDRPEVAISGKRRTSPIWDDSWAYLGNLRVVVHNPLPAPSEACLWPGVKSRLARVD